MTLNYDENGLEREFERYASMVREKLAEAKNDMTSELFQAISASKAAIDGLKTLAAYANEVKDISKRGEFMRIIGELSLELADVQIKLSEAIRENNGLKQRISALEKEVEDLKNPDTKLIVKNGLYYTSENEGPFCTGCYDGDRKTIRLTKLSGEFRELGEYQCPVCNHIYGQVR